jgi:hypothetical protein
MPSGKGVPLEDFATLNTGRTTTGASVSRSRTKRSRNLKSTCVTVERPLGPYHLLLQRPTFSAFCPNQVLSRLFMSKICQCNPLV